MSFTPVVRTSHSVPRTLMEFSKDYKIDPKKLDFELLEYETLIKREGDEEYNVIKNFSTLTPEEILNENVALIQEYSIKIKPLVPKKSYFKISLAVDKYKTKAQVTIHKGSVFLRTVEEAKHLRREIYKKKLRAGLFITFFETDINKQIKSFFAHVKPKQPLLQDVKFLVTHTQPLVMPVDAHLEMVYEQKQGYKKESIIDGVDVDELVMRYIKPKSGKDTRGCNGKYIKVREPKTLPFPEVDEKTITTKEDQDKIEYFAKIDGFVVFRQNRISISQALQMEGASFKKSAEIDSGDTDKEISVHIKHSKSHSEDAVGSGVHIDVQELNIDGNVGANVQIETSELNIDAQTHRDAKMEVANNANVKLHRGDLKAKDAQIDILETGKVTAQNSIHIKKMLGGEAIAPHVVVDELLSNSVIIASHSIEIKAIEGVDNKLIINPDAIEAHHKAIETLLEEKKVLTKEYDVAKRALEDKKEKHNDKLDRIKVFKKRVLIAKQEGKTPMKQDMIRLREFKKEELTLQELQVELDKKEADIDKVQQELDKLYEIEFHAKVIVHSSYDGHTQVTFVEQKEKQEVSLVPEGFKQELFLARTLDGALQIQAKL